MNQSSWQLMGHGARIQLPTCEISVSVDATYPESDQRIAAGVSNGRAVNARTRH